MFLTSDELFFLSLKQVPATFMTIERTSGILLAEDNGEISNNLFKFNLLISLFTVGPEEAPELK